MWPHGPHLDRCQDMRRSAAALVVSTIFRYNLKYARSRSYMPFRHLHGSISPWCNAFSKAKNKGKKID